MQKITALFQKYVLAVFGVGLFLVALIVLMVQSMVHTAAVEENTQRLTALTQERDTAQQTLDAAQVELYERITGSDAPRVTQDTQDLVALLDQMLTWDSHQSYVDARQSVLEDYDMDEQSLDALFPEAPVTTDSAGNEYYYIDAAGLNGRLGEYSVELLEVSGTDYSYVMFADMVSEQTLGNVTGSGTVPIIVFATVASDGELHDIRGYAGSEVTRSSRN